MFGLDSTPQDVIIRVIGVGGGGSNAVLHMAKIGMEGVDLICVNTDTQALDNIDNNYDIETIQIGKNLTKGLGIGANPEIGQQSALDSSEHLHDAILNSDILFIVAGMGGGTGTGASAVIAKLAREMGMLVIGIVSVPFKFEGANRIKIAMKGIEDLKSQVDTLITIPNDIMIDVKGRNSGLMEGFEVVDKAFSSTVQGISELITKSGVINVDFSDLKTVLTRGGDGAVGFGSSKSTSQAEEAVYAAIESPFLKEVNLSNARSILVNVASSGNMTLGDFQDIGAAISSIASEEATLFIGTSINDHINQELHVTIVATGLGDVNTQHIPDKKLLSRAAYGDINQTRFKKTTRISTAFDDIRLLVSEDVSTDDIANLIFHLSNVYKSVGGDGLTVENVTNIPPTRESIKGAPRSKRSASK